MSAVRKQVPLMLSVEQAAEQLGVSTKTIRRWITSRELHVHKLGRRVLIADEDLAAFVNARRR